MTLRSSTPGHGQQRLVPATAERLRDRVFACAAGEFLGSLGELAAALDVGIVTLQQAARVLEHEGLLDVRRGPRGGYYGRRPDSETIERALAAYMRMHPDSFGEALDITSLLFIELCGAAARCTDERFRDELALVADAFAACDDGQAMGELETHLQDLLFRMVDRPIFEMLTRVTLRFASAGGQAAIYRGREDVDRLIAGRQRIIAAIRDGDEALARFEADRSNRQPLLANLGKTRS